MTTRSHRRLGRRGAPVVCCLALVLTACGDDDPEAEDSDAADSSTATASTEAATTEPETTIPTTTAEPTATEPTATEPTTRRHGRTGNDVARTGDDRSGNRHRNDIER